MTQVSVTFQGDNWHAVRCQMYEALGLDYPAQPSTAGDFPELPALADPKQEGPEPAPEPAPAPRSHKKTRNASPAPTPPEPAPKVPEPQPPVAAQAPAAPAPERELPSLDALKALVTAAVRAAQQKERGRLRCSSVRLEIVGRAVDGKRVYVAIFCFA